MNLLLSVELKYQTDLNNEKISAGLRQEFKKISLSQNVTVLTEWLIIDKDNKRWYSVRKADENKLNIYTMEESDKFREYRRTNDPALREQLIMENQGLVRKAASKFLFLVFKGIMEQKDLEQAGMEGLIKAIKGFDPDKGYKFSTYAVPCIEGEIKKEIDRCRGISGIPPDLEKKARKVKSAVEEFTKKNGYEPTEQELAEQLQMSVDEIIEAWRLASMLFPEPLEEIDLSQGYDPFKEKLTQEAIPLLPLDQQKIVQLRLADYTLDQIAQELQMPPGTVRTTFYQQIIPTLKKLMKSKLFQQM